MLDSEFAIKLLNAFKKIDEEIDKEGGEFDFRYSFADHVLKDVLGWTRKSGEGHFRIEKERKDVVCFDDSSPPFPAIIIETKRPSEDLSFEDKEQLESYLQELGCAKYGILTNGRKLVLYSYSIKRGMEKISDLDIDKIVEKESYEFSGEELKGILELNKLTRDRYVKRGDADYFKNFYQEAPLRYLKGIEGAGYNLFINSLKQSLEELTDVMMRLFDAYYKRDDYSGQFLKSSFEDWESWREFSGTKGESKNIFCRETAYILLNRILFARICEDKHISDSKISGSGLADFIERHASIKNKYLDALEDAYRSVERHYNHFYQLNIFDWWRLDKDKKFLLKNDEKEEQGKLDEDLNYAVKNVLKRLNRFNFEVVDRDILGHVYEDYLSKEERKRLGEFYTPIEVVKYILDAVGYSPKKEIRGKDILDPACGSGTFLVEAVNRLIERYQNKLGKSVKELSSEESINILENIRDHIYGLDINPFACHITEINFLFRTIDLYNNVKQKYPDYTLQRFNIFCTDSLKLPESRESYSLDRFLDVNGRAKSFSDEKAQADAVKTMKFDFVVGNPPYVRVHKLTKESVQYYKKIYKSTYGKFDLYILFIEKGIGWLKKSGKIGYICSNKFVQGSYGEKLRDYILENCKVEQLIDFGDSGVFKDATNYPCIFVFEKTMDWGNLIKCARVARPLLSVHGEDETLIEIGRHLNVDYSDEYIDIFKYKQSQLSGESWQIMPPSELKTFEKIEKNATSNLGNEADNLEVGVFTGLNESYIVDEGTCKQEHFENDLLKKVLRGRDIRRWKISWNEIYVIFPYKDVNGQLCLIPEYELESNYLNCYRYLRRHKSNLESRQFFRQTPAELGKEWFEIWKPTYCSTPKIITPDISKNNNFSFDENEYYCLNTAYVTTLKNKTKGNYLLVTGLLNSKVCEFYFKHTSPFISGGYYRYITPYLCGIPLKFPENEKEQKNCKAITKKVDQILNLMKNVNEVEERISGFPDSYVKEEQKTSTLLNIMEDQNLSKESYSTSSLRIEPLKDLEEKMSYKLFLTKKDYIAFNGESSAEFVRMMLEKKDKVTKTDLLRLRLPSNENMEEIMKEYHGDVRKVEDIQNNVAGLEKEIDDAVYDLYGLEKDDKEIIENFLDKF